MQKMLPPGQFEIEDFPRFGLTKYADRYKAEREPLSLRIRGDVDTPLTLDAENLASLPRVTQVSDFHCVTSWSKCGLEWRGYRFRDVYEKIIKPDAKPHADATFVILKSTDGYRAILPLEDLLGDDVLLADTLDGEALCAAHGAPLRLLAPAHYGSKSVKHITTVEFWSDDSKYVAPAFKFMGHPRGRVAYEERSGSVPGWILRYLYRPLIKPTIRLFKRTMK
ncbi:MAG: molybdopterin-binding oxidoreductase [Alphaproteobacteria bacterium]|nr:MAG: molybdopterin-binding oxidoreductase [Alphaproteobacteria bacterium]